MSDESITQQHYEKIGRFIYGFQRYADPEKLRAAVTAGELAPDVAQRAAALVRRFDEAMDGLKHASAQGLPGAVDDEQLNAILADLRIFAQDSGWTHR